MSETYQPNPNQPSFCQICGRGVASEADRLAGNAFQCGLCNEVRLASPASTGYTPPGAPVDPTAGGAPGPGPNASGMPGAVPPFVPGTNPYASGSYASKPNPGLAALLGLIPGVGAMYNGQYAKGIVHLIVFAILVNLADSHDIFGLFVAGWIFYQAIEAHHTARARRDGTPLPNPFGLNDIGERFGFGKAWPAYSPAATTPPGGAPPQPPPSGTSAPNAGTPCQAPVSNWGAPLESYRYNAPPVTPYPPFTQTAYTPPVPPSAPVFDGRDLPPFDPTLIGFNPPYPATRNRFPAGAIWLIALGTLFLLNTSGVLHGFPFRVLLPLFFLGLGGWLFVHKMTETGHGMSDDGSPAYRIRLFRAARGSVWLILLGVIFFLADFDILPWSRSWPLFLILAGVMTFLERAVYSGAGADQYNYPPPGTQSFTTPEKPAANVSATETVKTNTDANRNDQEGR